MLTHIADGSGPDLSSSRHFWPTASMASVPDVGQIWQWWHGLCVACQLWARPGNIGPVLAHVWPSSGSGPVKGRHSLRYVARCNASCGPDQFCFPPHSKIGLDTDGSALGQLRATIAKSGPHPVHLPLAMPALGQKYRLDARSGPDRSAMWDVVFFVCIDSGRLKHRMQYYSTFFCL